ncbi:hypothetical protein J6590_063405 [Homalodisca vitripennis]|nr:hypothetical protein J6590_063405 [Homalodisca vitripennis]
MVRAQPSTAMSCVAARKLSAKKRQSRVWKLKCLPLEHGESPAIDRYVLCGRQELECKEETGEEDGVGTLGIKDLHI